MAGKIKVTKEQILDCAFEITRKEGIKNVNARRLGKELNCSLLPIYYNFDTMEKLKEELLKKVNNYYNSYIEKSKNATQKRFKSVGIYYIKFATEEKELFKLLFMREAKYISKFSVDVDDNTEYILQEICKEYGLTVEQAEKIHFESWVATHGLATMIATGYMKFSQKQISSYLTDIYVGLLIKIKGEIKDDKN